MMTRRDQISGKHLEFKDQTLADKQAEAKSKNHMHSAKCKAKGASLATPASANSGSLVFLKVIFGFLIQIQTERPIFSNW